MPLPQLVRKGLIAITGTTGVGKSQLAIELARALNGEVINADALQVYKGYDIITNKVADEEMMGVPHHLLGVVNANKEYTVQEFEQDALQKIDEVHQRNRIPILVGGTNYYIQSVMFRKSLINSTSRGPGSPDIKAETAAVDRRFEEGQASKSNQELWEELRTVDPVMAEKWHPNNRRKVLRSLEISHTTGRKHSEWIKESEEAREKEETLRFPTLLFWLYADTSVLNRRLDSRVDTMIERGMFGELDMLGRCLKDPNMFQGSSDDFSKGLKQAIGFREFEAYLAQTADPASSENGRAMLKEKGTKDMKTSTRRYAKRQITWIRNKLVPECRSTLDKKVKAHAYVLDATDLQAWSTAVKDKGIQIARQFISSSSSSSSSSSGLPDPASVSEAAAGLLSEVKEKPNSITAWKRFLCAVCSRTAEESKDGTAHEVWLNGEEEYNQHLRSRQHKKNTQHRKRLAQGHYHPRAKRQNR